ncbi:beta-mannosidase [Ephemerocybe angulata]|uniref:Beta-mannosidase B n=1 Tax=Ephemerocybe angulata TaxID=980116 RepID=A0A8H6I5B7_9AGAR|nr:beta-mannosidase [Tulosesus angulatus]
MSTSKIQPVVDLDFASLKWWWKEIRRPEAFDVTAELASQYTPDPKDEGDHRASRESIREQWYPASRFPSEVHVELLDREVIPDPYVAFHEHDVQWVGETEWLYTCTFDAPASKEAERRLVLDGLDTLCDIYLNDAKILQTDNAFRQYTYSEAASGVLKEKGNILLLHFRCAKKYATEQELVYGKVRAGSSNLGDPSRVYLRKPQYDWRWDWGPELMTCGPYRGIRLTTYSVCIDKLAFHPSAQLTVANGAYDLSLSVDLRAIGQDATLADVKVVTTLTDADEPKTLVDVFESVGLDTSNGTSKPVASWQRLQDKGVEPWWPVGYGKQKRYIVETRILGSDGTLIDSVSKVIGFRSIELVQEPLEEADQYGTGSTFLFKVNGVEMFMGGSNWIPADNFLTTITDERYRAWLELMRDGGQNMIRVWGGGIYEPDVFYDLCDELGLLVWQDFQFACGVYPAHDSFVDSVRQEAEYNVKRLRHHPSLALFCGNNEDYQMVLQWGDVSDFPAIVIYEEVLPKVVQALTGGTVPYHRGSPYGGKGWDTSDPTVGDVHQWNIWGGKELPWQEYGKLGGRFVSEFGIPAFPAMGTVKHWMRGVDPREWYAQSKAIAQHTRAGAYERRFAIVMNENFRVTEDLEKQVHAFNTQVMQAEAVGYAYRVWKREWRSEGKRYCGGVLVWQLNDCWPVVSWALVDYFLNPKPSFYVIKRELASLTIGVVREVIQDRPNDRPKQFYEYGATRSVGAKIHIWVTRTGGQDSEPLNARLDIQCFDLEDPDWHKAHDFSNAPQASMFAVSPNGTTELGTFECPEPGPLREGVYNRPGSTTSSGRVVVSARLLHPETGEVLARFVDWPQPYRVLDIPSASDAGVEIEVEGAPEDGDYALVKVRAKRPIKCLWLSVDSDEGGAGDALMKGAQAVRWSDNALDVVPGDEQVITVKGWNGGKNKAAKVNWKILQN